jgi:hypothetical protein
MDKTKTVTGGEIIESPELIKVTQALEASLKEGEEAAWEIGDNYNRIIDQKLAEKSGYRHAREFFSIHFKDVPQSTLSHYGALARAFSKSVVATYRVSRLSALLTYEKLAGLKPTDPDPGSVPIQVPGERELRPFADCHREELSKAIQQLKGHSAKELPPDDAAMLEKLHQALGEHEHNPIALTSRQGREGTLIVFTLALRELRSLMEALEKVLRGPEAIKASAEEMALFTQEFTKGMEAWGKTLEGKTDDKKT